MTFKAIIKSTLLFSLAAMVLNIGRLGLADNLSYLWLNWNLFLAIVPLFFAWLFTQTKNKYAQFFTLLLWLGFLPNSPYIVTDFIHLADVGPKSILWYDGIMIFFYTMAGMLVWISSSFIIQQKAKWNEWFMIIIGLLSGFGLYLGRYIRFNTWDIIANPFPLFETIGDIFIHPQNHSPVILMTFVVAFMFIILFKLFSHHEKTKN